MRDINFFKKREISYKLLKNNYIKIFIIILIINFIFIIYSNHRVRRIKLHRNNLELILSKEESIVELDDLEENETRLENLKYLKDENQNLIKSTYKTNKNKFKIESILVLVPENLFIERIDLESEKTTIIGNSIDKTKIYNFYRFLRGLDFAYRASIDEILKIEETYNFKISF